MSIEARILGKLDATNVQIEINSSKGSSKPNYYKVPENKADAFIADYEKAVKKTLGELYPFDSLHELANN